MYNEIRHIREGNFEVLRTDGKTKVVGPNICGMIRYTYFEDDTLRLLGGVLVEKFNQ